MSRLTIGDPPTVRGPGPAEPGDVTRACRTQRIRQPIARRDESTSGHFVRDHRTLLDGEPDGLLATVTLDEGVLYLARACGKPPIHRRTRMKHVDRSKACRT